jgi:broad specificity phosphatase PhoE
MVKQDQSADMRERFDSLEWTAAARSLLERGNDLLPGVPSYLFLRHSHRESPKNGPVLETMPITALGRDMAVEFGHRLSAIVSNGYAIYHSPLLRCQQTAEAIQAGLQRDGNDVELQGIMDELVDVRGSKVAIANIQEKHGLDWLNYWLLGFFPEDDIEPAAHYGWRVCNKITQVSMDHPAAFHIMIGHDNTLLALRGVVAGIPVDASWLPYLGGFWMQFGPDAIHYSDAGHASRDCPYPFWWGKEENVFRR